MGNKSFIIYDNDLKSVAMLPTSKIGKLFYAVIQYRLNGTLPDFGSDLALKILFNQIKDHIDMNEEKYEEIRQTKVKAAKARWQKEKAKQETFGTPPQNNESLCKTMHVHTESNGECYNDNVNDNDNANDTDNVNVNADGNACAHSDTQINTQTQKRAYGTYLNVFLYDWEYCDLSRRFSVNLNDIINSMSSYLKTTGKVYADCYVKLLGWKLYSDAAQSPHSPPPKPQPSYDLEEYKKRVAGLKYVKKQ